MPIPIIRPEREILTIPAMLARSALDFGPQVALRMRRGSSDSWREITYSQLFITVRALAASLIESGLSKGSRVALVSENRPDWALGYLGVLEAGGVVVPLDARLTERERMYILREAEAETLIAGGKFAEEALSLKGEMPALSVVSMDRELASLIAAGKSLLEEKPAALAARVPQLDDVAVILYTSGTTGSSKGVALSHRNLMSNVEAAYRIVDFAAGDNFFSVLPLHHAFEATMGMLAPLSSGASITYARSLKPNEIRQDLSATKATILIAVPLLLEKVLKGIYREVAKAPLLRRMLFGGLTGAARLLDRATAGRASKILLSGVREKAGLGTLRYVFSGGAALPPWVFDGLQALGFTVMQGYGLSESSPVLTCNPPSRRKRGSVGPAIPGVELRIDGEGPDGVGEILARGPAVMLGYHDNPEATAEAIDQEGWLHTGDLGYIDADGYLYITGRKKSVIVTGGGKNIYPEEVEAVLLDSPYIEEALVVAGRNPRTGDEQVEAIVFPNFEEVDRHFTQRGEPNPSSEDIRDLIAEETKKRVEVLADFKRPRRLSVREEEFPKTTTRKIKRYLFQTSSVEIPARSPKRS